MSKIPKFLSYTSKGGLIRRNFPSQVFWVSRKGSGGSLKTRWWKTRRMFHNYSIEGNPVFVGADARLVTYRSASKRLVCYSRRSIISTGVHRLHKLRQSFSRVTILYLGQAMLAAWTLCCSLSFLLFCVYVHVLFVEQREDVVDPRRRTLASESRPVEWADDPEFISRV